MVSTQITAQQPTEKFAERMPGVASSSTDLLLAAEKRINSILDQKRKKPLNFENEQLNTILELITDQYGIPIVFDNSALDEVAISPESKITIHVRDISLRSALNLMFRAPGLEDLTYVLEDEVLLITTDGIACGALQTKVYAVGDLLRTSHRFNVIQTYNNLNMLIDVIVSTVEMDSWFENGSGEGEVQFFSPAVLVISQTRRVHDLVEDLLDELRRAQQQMTSSIKSPQKQLATQGFAIKVALGEDLEKSRQQLATAIKKSVDWSSHAEGEEVWIEMLPERVLVRHQPTVLRQVEIVLRDMKVLDPKVAAVYGPSRSGKQVGAGSFGG